MGEVLRIADTRNPILRYRITTVSILRDLADEFERLVGERRRSAIIQFLIRLIVICDKRSNGAIKQIMEGCPKTFWPAVAYLERRLLPLLRQCLEAIESDIAERGY